MAEERYDEGGVPFEQWVGEDAFDAADYLDGPTPRRLDELQGEQRKRVEQLLEKRKRERQQYG